MNPFKKMKLKAILRNCNYILAGTVIKQQYYDGNRNSEINRLIDQFMSDPGFDNAIKLIEHNEMMVFYFTESCDGGLYVRKSQPQPGPSTERVEPPASNVVTPHTSNADRPPATKKIEPPTTSNLVEPPEPPTADVVEATSTKNVVMPRRQSEPETIPDADSLRGFKEASVAMESSPKLEDKPPKKKMNFPNVIATLNMDIHTMIKQLEDYRQQLSFGSSDEEQLKAWSRALERAIQEFSAAIDHLEGDE